MEDIIKAYPKHYKPILKETNEMGFNQLSNEKEGSLLATLCASKRAGTFLELGTGTGLCTSWILQGMCCDSTLLSVDSDEKLVALAKKHLGSDDRVIFLIAAGENTINRLSSLSIDLIFADTWPGKYNHLQ